LLSTSPCKIAIFDYSVKVHASDYDYESQTVLFWIKIFKFDTMIVDYFNNFAGIQDFAISCVDNITSYCNHHSSGYYTYTIDTIHNNLMKNATICCHLIGQEQAITVLLSIAIDSAILKRLYTLWFSGKGTTVLMFYTMTVHTNAGFVN